MPACQCNDVFINNVKSVGPNRTEGKEATQNEGLPIAQPGRENKSQTSSRWCGVKGWKGTAQVSSSSFGLGSKLGSPSQSSPRLPSKWDVDKIKSHYQLFKEEFNFALGRK
ncbi:hypothetical protein AVEN_201888-1 [Araneus ventricosus]|uniref:Uncharacterized protein n=1 Tax=Araneus ventricosus TaxID=182803 RepID=A0A4Y2G2A3_ARAVE|nr:hypothetical protein AVEN_201888-1 [Araneus ventricosus]